MASPGPVVIGGAGMHLLWYWKQAGCLPQHRDLLRTQAQVEDMQQDSIQLGCTCFEDPWADTIVVIVDLLSCLGRV